MPSITLDFSAFGSKELAPSPRREARSRRASRGSRGASRNAALPTEAVMPRERQCSTPVPGQNVAEDKNVRCRTKYWPQNVGYRFPEPFPISKNRKRLWKSLLCRVFEQACLVLMRPVRSGELGRRRVAIKSRWDEVLLGLARLGHRAVVLHTTGEPAGPSPNGTESQRGEPQRDQVPDRLKTPYTSAPEKIFFRMMA